MLFTISTTYNPATDLGFLLYKNPGSVQEFDLPYGKAHVFYPEATAERCTVALLLDIDPVSLVRGRKGSQTDGALDQYVNDRPYVASSFLSVAMTNVFRSAMSGKSRERPELAGVAIPLEATISAVECRGGLDLLKRLFEPLGYEVEAEKHLLDDQFPEWGDSPYYMLKLRAICKLSDLLTHVYVLMPVLDNDKHYWVGEEEVEKLLRHGQGWLAEHPEKTYITNRYLKHRKRLTRMALERLVEEEDLDPDGAAAVAAGQEEAIERGLSLNERRLGTVLAVLRQAGAKRVIDMGCGEGKLLGNLLAEREFKEIVGVDVSYRVLEMAARRLRIDNLPERQQERIKLMQGSLTYRDKRMEGFDAATCIEVIEHLDLPRLSAFERVIFEFARPATVIMTTPNVEYNVKFESMPAGKLRHRDHRFEWTRAEFQGWAEAVAARHGYKVRYLPVGDEDPVVGPPTQMAVFSL